MSPRRPAEDEPEAFDPAWDDDVFVEGDGGQGRGDERPDGEDDAPPRRRASGARGSARKSRAGRAREAQPEHGRRGRRGLRIAGIAALALVLAAFVISFVSGLRGGSGTRVTGDAEEAAAELDRIGPRIKVEVLNAAGVSGLARLATDHLRDRGFDVVYMGNAGSFEQDSTVVFARTSDIDAAHRVARALGTDSVVVEPEPDLFVDATVRHGKDWPRPGATDAADPGFLGRVRGWLE